MVPNHSGEINEQEEELQEPQPLFWFLVFLLFRSPPHHFIVLGEIWVVLDVMNVRLPEVCDLFSSKMIQKKINKKEDFYFLTSGKVHTTAARPVKPCCLFIFF